LEAAGFYIENEILAHDGQSDKSEVAFAHSDRKVNSFGIGETELRRNP
jgi:hypothetical protein